MLIKPVVSLMLRCGVTWKDMSELLRLVCVEVATKDYGKHGRPANVSRVAILTDMSRRDVRRARDLLQDDAGTGLDALQRMSRATQILSGWYRDPKYLDAKGRPRLLKVKGTDGVEGLLRRCSRSCRVSAPSGEPLRDGCARSPERSSRRRSIRTASSGRAR
jgi:hypothetical protein